MSYYKDKISNIKSDIIIYIYIPNIYINLIKRMHKLYINKFRGVFICVCI